MLGTQKGYLNTRQIELVKKNALISPWNQPVIIKPVIILNYVYKISRSHESWPLFLVVGYLGSVPYYRFTDKSTTVANGEDLLC